MISALAPSRPLVCNASAPSLVGGRVRRGFLAGFILAWVTAIAATYCHYAAIFPGNNLAWIAWWIALGCLWVAMGEFSAGSFISRPSRRTIVIVGATVAAYLACRLVNLDTSPWNNYGLFDDAAWDIHFANNHVFRSDVPFQIAYFDTQAGSISREVVFHYYITLCFKLLGYNLAAFNFALLFLGGVTVVATVLVVDALLKDVWVTIAAGLVMLTLPMQVTHSFMGHRYAIVAPLMMVSYYLLISGIQRGSRRRLVAAGIFGALCVQSAIMGKQYILALALGAATSVLFVRRADRSFGKLKTALPFILSLVAGLTPLVFYILFNTALYSVREKDLVQEFLRVLRLGGWDGIRSYREGFYGLFFSSDGSQRFFIPDFLPIPLSYYLLVVTGLWISWKTRRYEIVFAALLPVAAAFVAGSYDFRVLIALPFWVIALAYGVQYGLSHYRETHRSRLYRSTAALVTASALALGLFSSARYLSTLSTDPNHIWLLCHRDVAVARVFQDIAAGEAKPSPNLKLNEFNRPAPKNPPYDLLVAPESAYAVAHLFLQNFRERKLLSFTDYLPQRHIGGAELLQRNIDAIACLPDSKKDLKLVWEVTDNSQPVIDQLKPFVAYGMDELLEYSVDATPFQIYVLTISGQFRDQFRSEILKARNPARVPKIF